MVGRVKPIAWLLTWRVHSLKFDIKTIRLAKGTKFKEAELGANLAPLLPSDVSALSDARKVESAEKQALVRAFDKAVRRKPLAFAADAVGLWELHVAEEGRGPRGSGERVERWGRWEMLQGGCNDHDGCEARNVSATRHTAT